MDNHSEKTNNIGAIGHREIIADIVYKMNKWERIYFLDDNKFKKILLTLMS